MMGESPHGKHEKEESRKGANLSSNESEEVDKSMEAGKGQPVPTRPIFGVGWTRSSTEGNANTSLMKILEPQTEVAKIGFFILFYPIFILCRYPIFILFLSSLDQIPYFSKKFLSFSLLFPLKLCFFHEILFF